ncbi:MAG: hypothetical protein WCK76_01530, partial [Elusimicrobiota bacterium]
SAIAVLWRQRYAGRLIRKTGLAAGAALASGAAQLQEEATLRDIDVDFVKDGRKAANYKGHSSKIRDVYTYQGECR